MEIIHHQQCSRCSNLHGKHDMAVVQPSPRSAALWQARYVRTVSARAQSRTGPRPRRESRRRPRTTRDSAAGRRKRHLSDADDDKACPRL